MHDRVTTDGAALLGRALVSADRATLEAFIAAAIDLLDLADGDPDIEEDDAPEDDDPAGDPLDAGEADDADHAPPVADLDAYRAQRARIRAYRCFPIERRWRDRGVVHVEVARYELMQEPRVPSRRQLLRRRRGMPRSPRA